MSDHPASDEGLVHLGLLYDSPDELVATVTPHLRRALDRGNAVSMIVDRQVARLVRDELGPAADRIAFPPTRGVRDGEAFLGELCAIARPDRRSLVVGQYSAVDTDESSCALREDGVNLVLADRGLTLVCACARTADAGMLAAACRSHPGLITDGAPGGNPEFRAPLDRSPVPARIWGPPALRVLFRDTGDLNRVRVQVGRVVGEVGLRGDDAKAAVLAVHEAAVLVARPERESGAGPGDGGPGLDGLGLDGPGDDELSDHELDTAGEPDRVLEIRTSAGSLLSEIRAPLPAAPEEAPGLADLVPPTTVEDIGRYCRQVTIDDSGDTRVIRVLTGVDGGPTAVEGPG